MPLAATVSVWVILGGVVAAILATIFSYFPNLVQIDPKNPVAANAAAINGNGEILTEWLHGASTGAC